MKLHGLTNLKHA